MNKPLHQDALRQELADEAQRIAIDAEYLGRQHLIASEGWRRRATLVAIPATVLIAALAAAGAGVAALLGADSRLTVVLAFLAAIASVARMLLRPADEAGGHSIKGLQYLAVGADARRLRNIGLRTDRDLVALRKELDQLVDRLNALREMEPRALSAALLEKVRERVRRGDYAYEKDPLWEPVPGALLTDTSETALEQSVQGSQDPGPAPGSNAAGAPSAAR
jgi:hypothetical protein